MGKSIGYYRSEERIEIIVRDESGRKIETLSCTRGDKKKYGKLLRYLKDKYGFQPEVPELPKPEEIKDWWE